MTTGTFGIWVVYLIVLYPIRQTVYTRGLGMIFCHLKIRRNLVRVIITSVSLCSDIKSVIYGHFLLYWFLTKLMISFRPCLGRQRHVMNVFSSILILFGYDRKNPVHIKMDLLKYGPFIKVQDFIIELQQSYLLPLEFLSIMNMNQK